MLVREALDGARAAGVAFAKVGEAGRDSRPGGVAKLASVDVSSCSDTTMAGLLDDVDVEMSASAFDSSASAASRAASLLAKLKVGGGLSRSCLEEAAYATAASP